MKELSVSSTANALIVFADVVDSSVYSSILGIEKFADKVISFQKLFSDLGNQYFNDQPYFEDKVDSYCRVDSRGDEGSVFVVDPRQQRDALVYKAVQFALELKARLKILNKQEADMPPTEMRIGIGIHYGEVAIITTTTPESKGKEEVFRNLIDRIIGYSINYAKRVESSSRMGRFSQVFLSKEAADLLSYCPVVLCRHEASLKGIQANDEVYEIRSAFLSDVPLPTADGAGGIKNEDFFSYFTDDLNEAQFLREPWLKSLVLSMLASRESAAEDNTIKTVCRGRISEIAWRKPTENDPILLYWRALECQECGKYSRAVSCLREILREYPYFIFARIKTVEACHHMIKSNKKTPSEIIFVRDTAEELLERYKNILNATEILQLENILAEARSEP